MEMRSAHSLAQIVLLSVSLFAVALPAQAQVYVSASGDNTTGLSWATAKHNVQDAIDLAEIESADVWIAQGTYLLDTALSAADGTHLLGGFPSTGNPGLGERDAKTHVTILDGQTTVSHVIVCDGVIDVLIDGLTLRGGRSVTSGGGVYCINSSSSVSIQNCVITRNSATVFGGGIDIEHASATIAHCEFSDNAAMEGAGLKVHLGTATVTDCSFHGNTAGTLGGGIEGYDSPITADRCIFTSNTANTKGGGISMHEGGYAAIMNCLFASNASYDQGGGVNFEYQTDIALANCTFANNVGGTRGGGVFLHSSAGSIVNCIFSGNTHYAIYENNANADPMVMNCLFYSNPNGLYFDEATTAIVSVSGPDGLLALVPEAHDCIEGNPAYVNAAAGDFHIKLGSPCLDAGTSLGAPLNDIDGESRPFVLGTARRKPALLGFDIGYDEYVDTDGDGLTDVTETAIGTDPNVADSDGDGIDDGTESLYGLNPMNPADAASDTDGDGLTALQELTVYHTDPGKKDSDSDGYWDGFEVAHGSGPVDSLSVPAPSGVPGDVNVDGAANAIDVQTVINGALNLPTPVQTDLTGDGLTNALDVQTVINDVLGVR